jgi:hypothetical protein
MTAPDAPGPAAELRRAADALARAADALEGASSPLSKARSKPPSKVRPSDPPVPLTLAEHRRQHRPGHPARLDADAELRAFVLARLDAMTYHQLEAAVAATFPPDRKHAPRRASPPLLGGNRVRHLR